MAAENASGTPGMDAFTSFWSDFLGKMASPAGAAAPPTPLPTPELVNRMRQAFFDALAQHAEAFLGSEAFLAVLKQSMDNALAWQQMMNQYLQKGLSTLQMPTRVDSEHVVTLIRGMEERLRSRLDELTARVERLEGGARARKRPPPRKAPRR